MKGRRPWRLGWVLSCLGVGLLLLAGCDTSRDADNQVSRVRIVLDTQAFTHSGHASAAPQALANTRQVVDPLSISRIRVGVLVPEDNAPIIVEVVDVTGPDVLVDLEVPQGPGRHIRVDAFNPFEAVIFSGETVVDLFLPVHDIELFLSPVFSANVAARSSDQCRRWRSVDGGVGELRSV